MRNLSVHKINPANDLLTVQALDGPGPGNASHNYRIVLPTYHDTEPERATYVAFQNGPIAEVGVNGVTQEALLAILIDRLEGFQSGPYACAENAAALNHLRSALDVLHSRTKARMARHVEGTHAV